MVGIREIFRTVSEIAYLDLDLRARGESGGSPKIQDKTLAIIRLEHASFSLSPRLETLPR